MISVTLSETIVRYKQPLELNRIIECGYFNYIVHNPSEQKDYITGFAYKGEFVGNYPNLSFVFAKSERELPNM